MPWSHTLLFSFSSPRQSSWNQVSLTFKAYPNSIPCHSLLSVIVVQDSFVCCCFFFFFFPVSSTRPYDFSLTSLLNPKPCFRSAAGGILYECASYPYHGLSFLRTLQCLPIFLRVKLVSIQWTLNIYLSSHHPLPLNSDLPLSPSLM